MTTWALAAGDFTPLGGMDRANHALARYLATSGRDVHLVAHRVWDDLAALPRVTVHRVSRPLGSHLLGVPLLARAASTVAQRVGPDARYLSNGGNTAWTAPTWIHYLHAAYRPDTSGTRARLTASASRRRYLADEARTLAAAPLVICNSERTAADVCRHYRMPSTRVRVVYYGVDAAQFAEADDAARARARQALGLAVDGPLAMFVGALGDRRKGFDVLFEAWRDLCRDHAWDADLVVVGEGAEAAAWRGRVEQEGLSPRVRFLGFRGDIPDVLAAADVLVHPSRYEAYGLGVHEALCRGIPAIVSSAAGVTERMTAAFAPLLLPDPASAATLAERLRTWRADWTSWRARAREVGAQLRSRSWDDMARELAALLEES